MPDTPTAAERARQVERTVLLLKGNTGVVHLFWEAEAAVTALCDRVDTLTAARLNTEWDGTDAAEPAWWRGQDDGVRGAVERIRAALDGTDDGSGALGNADLERCRRDVLALTARVAELERERNTWRRLAETQPNPIILDRKLEPR